MSHWSSQPCFKKEKEKMPPIGSFYCPNCYNSNSGSEMLNHTPMEEASTRIQFLTESTFPRQHAVSSGSCHKEQLVPPQTTLW